MFCHEFTTPYLMRFVEQSSTTYMLRKYGINWKQGIHKQIMYASNEIQLALGTLVQGSQTVMEYFTKLNIIWEELHLHRPSPSCNCGKCTCQALTLTTAAIETDQMFQFLMGLNESYDGIRGQIIMMSPVPSLERAYSIILTEERQKNSRHGGIKPNDAATYQMRQPNPPYQPKRKGRETVKCSHCGYHNHTVDKCFRLIGFPQYFKFTKKPAYGKTNAELTHGPHGAPAHYQPPAHHQPPKFHYAHNVASTSADVSTQYNNIKNQVTHLMQLLDQGVHQSAPSSMAPSSSSGASDSHDQDDESTDPSVTYTTLGGKYHCTIPKHFLCSTSHDLHDYFIIDFGATNHVVCDKSLFTSHVRRVRQC